MKTDNGEDAFQLIPAGTETRKCNQYTKTLMEMGHKQHTRTHTFIVYPNSTVLTSLTGVLLAFNPVAFYCLCCLLLFSILSFYAFAFFLCAARCVVGLCFLT